MSGEGQKQITRGAGLHTVKDDAGTRTGRGKLEPISAGGLKSRTYQHSDAENRVLVRRLEVSEIR